MYNVFNMHNISENKLCKSHYYQIQITVAEDLIICAVKVLYK